MWKSLAEFLNKDRDVLFMFKRAKTSVPAVQLNDAERAVVREAVQRRASNGSGKSLVTDQNINPWKLTQRAKITEFAASGDTEIATQLLEKGGKNSELVLEEAQQLRAQTADSWAKTVAVDLDGPVSSRGTTAATSHVSALATKSSTTARAESEIDSIVKRSR